jgi:hypothetical protein
MADGSRPVTSDEKEARAAAADAAVEERADARHVAKPSARRRSAAAPAYAAFSVNVWLTDLNSVEFGLYKHSRNKAKSRQFTSDMDIYAEVIENGERTGLIGYREELWKKSTGMDKRLVFKLFGDKLNWRATMDLMLGKSLQLTLGARGLPVTVYSMNIGDHEHVVYMERSAYKWPGMPENFSFFLMEDGKPSFYRLRQRFVDLGGDYTLIDQRGKSIGWIDGKLLTIGGSWRVKVREEAADPRLMMVLKLFCGMLPFNRSCRRHIGRLASSVANGRIEPALEKQETDLYMNPRRVR